MPVQVLLILAVGALRFAPRAAHELTPLASAAEVEVFDEDCWDGAGDSTDVLKVSLLQTATSLQRRPQHGPAVQPHPAQAVVSESSARLPDEAASASRPSAAVHNILTRWQRDIFGSRPRPRRPEEGLAQAVSADEWVLLFGIVGLLVSLDYFVIRRPGGGVRHHVAMVGLWVAVGFGYNLYVGWRYGMELALDWSTGWILEWILSFDNLFLFHVLFRLCKTPQEWRPKALFFGIVGAFFLRLIMISLFDSLISAHAWIRLVFGTFLIYSGIVAVQEDEEVDEPSKGYPATGLKYLLGDRFDENYDSEGRLFPVGADGRLRVSMLAAVIAYVELTDVVFAIDSVSAKVAQLPNQFIVFSSSVLALCGLRAMFFVLQDAVEYFEHLKYGICVVLLFIGLELILAPFVRLDSWTVLIVIASVCVISVASSAAKRVRDAKAREALPCLATAALAHEAG